MAAQVEESPAPEKRNAVDKVGNWFWNFLKGELTPYPGRVWVVGRVTLASTIVMLLVMTFRIPGGFLGAIFTMFINRENPVATMESGLRIMAAVILATVFNMVGVATLVDDPLTHFLWIAASLFVCFFMIRVMNDYLTAASFGFTIAGAIPLWDETTLNVNDRVENTLWLAGVVIIGVVVSIAIEYLFRGVHPVTDLTEGIEERLRAVEYFLRSASSKEPLAPEWEKKLSLYGTVGTSRLRRLILRSNFSSHYKSQMNTAIGLVGRLVDTAASFRLSLAERGTPIDAADQARCIRLADQVEKCRRSLLLSELPAKVSPAQNGPSSLPFLATMERTAAYIPDAFSGSTSIQEFITTPFDEEEPTPIFVRDALSNSSYLQFAIRGTLAAMISYTAYTALDWHGLGTSIATCFVTALSTIGSSRQKQILRLGGALIGGFVFGMGAQVFVLPYLDTIAGFTVLYVVVTAISAWIGTASARLSYLGLQAAFAFYLINLQEFSIQTSLAIARDRVFGVLLGLLSMWLLFDRLWVRNALDEMENGFAHNLEMFAELTEQMLVSDQDQAILRIRQLRDRLNTGFEAVRAQSDAVVFEFGPTRRWKLQIRDDIRRWQPAMRTLLQVQVTSAQYLSHKPLKNLPAQIAQAGVAFEQDIAQVMRSLAAEVAGKTTGAVPDIHLSAARMREGVDNYYRGRGLPVSGDSSDVIGLADSLATILAPLYEDIHDTFAARRPSERLSANGG